MTSAPTFAARNDQMICCSQRSLIGLPLTAMRFGGTSSPVAAAMALPRIRPSIPVKADSPPSERIPRGTQYAPFGINVLSYGVRPVLPRSR